MILGILFFQGGQISLNSNNIRYYTKTDVIFFKKTNEEWGGLSNMAPRYPISLNNIIFKNSEVLYQVFRFPGYPMIQAEIIEETSPMTAKMKSKKYMSLSRCDWNKVRVSVMRWVLRAKLACNFEKFSKLLINTENNPIVEYSSKDDFWGAFKKDDVFVGQNVLGRLLMELREEIRMVNYYNLKRPEFENAIIINQNFSENCIINKINDSCKENPKARYSQIDML
jgi:ribA/ribD-fused uncharacterized protein